MLYTPSFGNVWGKVEKFGIVGEDFENFGGRQVMTSGGVHCPKSIMVTYPFFKINFDVGKQKKNTYNASSV